jgi:alpha-1,2-mannosyltransferase
LRLAEARALRFAPLVLGLSLACYAWRLTFPQSWGMIDLKVYWSLAPNLLTDQLYSVTMPFTADFPLPFTYPPFGAVVFLPLSALPWLAARVVWQLLSLLCLWWLVRTALTLLARAWRCGASRCARHSTSGRSTSYWSPACSRRWWPCGAPWRAWASVPAPA